MYDVIAKSILLKLDQGFQTLKGQLESDIDRLARKVNIRLLQLGSYSRWNQIEASISVLWQGPTANARSLEPRAVLLKKVEEHLVEVNSELSKSAAYKS